MTLRLPRVIGHRGAAAAAPENTLASIRRAAEEGAPWVEFDVMLTADGVPVLFHDDSLLRTTGREGAMSETPFAALAGLEVGAWFAPEFAGEPLPSLEQALALMLELGLHPYVEIKSTRGRDVETAVRALEVAEACWPGDRPPPLFCSFSVMSLAALRALRPGLPLALNALAPAEGWRDQLRALGCLSYHLLEREVTPELARAVHEAGYQLASYTVNEGESARRLVAQGVDAIVTDRPAEIAAALAS